MRAFAALLVIALGLLAGSCSSVIDADQARLCRAVAPALHDDGIDIREVSLNPVPGAPNALKLSYRSVEFTGVVPRWLICTFAGQSGVGRFDLIAVDTDRGALSDIKLLILKRWWLADVGPTISRAPLRIPARPAYWLQQSLNGIVLAGIYGLIATSFALVYGLLGRINLAFGEVAVAGGINMLVMVSIVSQFGRLGPVSLIFALLCGIVAAALLSWVIGRFIVAPLTARTKSTQPVLIATIAVALVVTEILRITAPFRENWLPALFNRPIPIAANDQFIVTVTAAQLLAAGMCLTGASMILGLLAFSRFGRAWRAYSEDPLMAAMLGVRVPILRTATFLISGATAGLAGTVVVIAYGTITPGDGLSITLKALISAVIGGIGSVPGAFLGAALVAVVETVWSSSFEIVYRDVVIYSLLAAFLVLRPGGLLNRAAPSPREF